MHKAISTGLVTASRLLVAISARAIACVDETVTIDQFRALAILSHKRPISIATLSGLLGAQRSTTGQMVERLGWGWAAAVWAYALSWFLVNDRVKLANYYWLDHRRKAVKATAGS